ncbi:MAG: 30S ribosomal protein S4 [Candidatus Micrarchaeota archaeon]
MGDPPKLRNKYSRPKRLWDVDRLKEEKGLKKEYGLKNMRELWVVGAKLKKYRREARRLLSLPEDERERDKAIILNKLVSMGILKTESTVEDILSLGVKAFLERRLQTIVYKKGLARSIDQSRQLITHGFVSVNGGRVSIPSYFVDSGDEADISYSKKIDIEPPKAAEPVKEAAATKVEGGKPNENSPATPQPKAEEAAS